MLRLREIFHSKILYIIVLAFVLRILFIENFGVFTTSDEMYLFQNSLKPLTFLLNYSFSNYAAELFRFFNFNWGWGTLAISTVSNFFLYLFKIPITELTYKIPYILVGTWTVYFVYLFGKELKNKQVGLYAALIMAIYPTYVSLSRSGGVNTVPSTFFFFLTLYLFLIYFKEGKYKGLAFFSLGLYFCTDLQSYGILPLVFVLGLMFRYKNGIIKSCFNLTKELVFSLSALFFFIPTVPVILAALYLVSKGLLQNSYLLHIFQKSGYFGFFLYNFSYVIFLNAGPFLFVLFAIGILYCIIRTYKLPGDKAIIFVIFWFFLHIIPWIFIVIPSSTVVSDYIIHPTSALIFLSALFLTDLSKVLKKNKLFLFVILIVLILPTLFVISAVVYKTIPFYENYNLAYVDTDRGTEMYIYGVPLGVHRGIVRDNTGIKSAGYYIREISDENVVIFSDQESFVTEYYVGRTVAGQLDLFGEEEILESYQKLSSEFDISFVYLEEKDYPNLRNIIESDGFDKIVFITQDDEVIGTLYAKEYKDPIVLDIEITDPLFDNKYGNLQSLFVDYD